MTGCGKTDRDSIENKHSAQIEKIDTQDNQEQVESENNVPVNTSTENENYETYSEFWTESGISHDIAISDGGTELSVTITNKTELNGYLYSQQGTSERIAEIDNITGKIKIMNVTINLQMMDGAVQGLCIYGFWMIQFV